MVLAKHCHGAVTSLSRIAAGLIQQRQSDHGMISEYNQRIAITLLVLEVQIISFGSRGVNITN